MDYDGIVVGGGHAGIEASLALSRLGFSVILVTQNLDAVGRLSCNPAIGGLSKGNIVREIDALGGEMGKLIDASMIQFRILNQRRGPAVQAPRAQADKYLYARLAKDTLEGQDHLAILQDTVTELLFDGTKITGVKTERGSTVTAGAVVLTTGTFMEARIFIGDYIADSGRLGEPSAKGLGDFLRSAGFSVSRLKTGTPARVARSSLDFGKLTVQDGDPEMKGFSFSSGEIHRPRAACYITYTNQKTHQIIRDSLDRSPLYSGKIVGRGPRYCPSIEDKVVKFPDRDRHHLFVEPEGYNSEEMYLNGVSSSLPEEVQVRFLRSISGLERVEIMRPGYAVEYDFLDPRQLYPSLQNKKMAGLFIAGQTNGTSGYEEAACQGLMAGINAARYLQKKDPIVLSRAEAYTGVLIDDLVTLGTEEPYRMFTSRAEYRMNLRHDSSDLRLMPIGNAVGLQSDDMMERLLERKSGIEEIKELLRKRSVRMDDVSAHNDLDKHLGKTLYQLAKSPELQIESLPVYQELLRYPPSWLTTALLDIKYEGYIARQDQQIHKFQKMENMKIPAEFDYGSVTGLSNESREKLMGIRPISIGQASRISGVRSPDIAVLMLNLHSHKRAK